MEFTKGMKKRVLKHCRSNGKEITVTRNKTLICNYSIEKTHNKKVPELLRKWHTTTISNKLNIFQAFLAVDIFY